MKDAKTKLKMEKKTNWIQTSKLEENVNPAKSKHEQNKNRNWTETVKMSGKIGACRIQSKIRIHDWLDGV